MKYVLATLVGLAILAAYAYAARAGWRWTRRRTRRPEAELTVPAGHSFRAGDRIKLNEEPLVVVAARATSVTVSEPWPDWLCIIVSAVAGVYAPVWVPVWAVGRWMGFWRPKSEPARGLMQPPWSVGLTPEQVRQRNARFTPGTGV